MADAAAPNKGGGGKKGGGKKGGLAKVFQNGKRLVDSENRKEMHEVRDFEVALSEKKEDTTYIDQDAGETAKQLREVDMGMRQDPRTGLWVQRRMNTTISGGKSLLVTELTDRVVGATWNCSGCGFENIRKRTRCGKCQAEMPIELEELFRASEDQARRAALAKSSKVASAAAVAASIAAKEEEEAQRLRTEEAARRRAQMRAAGSALLTGGPSSTQVTAVNGKVLTAWECPSCGGTKNKPNRARCFKCGEAKAMGKMIYEIEGADRSYSQTGFQENKVGEGRLGIRGGFGDINQVSSVRKGAGKKGRGGKSLLGGDYGGGEEDDEKQAEAAVAALLPQQVFSKFDHVSRWKRRDSRKRSSRSRRPAASSRSRSARRNRSRRGDHDRNGPRPPVASNFSARQKFDATGGRGPAAAESSSRKVEVEQPSKTVAREQDVVVREGDRGGARRDAMEVDQEEDDDDEELPAWARDDAPVVGASGPGGSKKADAKDDNSEDDNEIGEGFF